MGLAGYCLLSGFSAENASNATFLTNSPLCRDLSRWNVSNVRNLANAFRQAPRFSSDLSAWDTSSVTNLYSTFYGGKLEADLSAWDVSRVQDMSFAFFSKLRDSRVR